MMYEPDLDADMIEAIEKARLKREGLEKEFR